MFSSRHWPFCFRCAGAALLVVTLALPAAAQLPSAAPLPPQIGYVHPAGAMAGTTVEVRIGGLDWTPDMQIFLHDPRVKLEITGPPSPVIVAEPPYWFGKKARGADFPMAREFPAKLTVPADMPPGIVRYQAANANGATATGRIAIGVEPEVLEVQNRREPQRLPALPVTVSGQVMKIEEVDRYVFSVPKAGPVTCQLLARRVGSPLNAVVQLRDAQGRMLIDLADTEGRDANFTFVAEANVEYLLSVHDADFRGNRQFTYRVVLTAGPRVVAAIPAVGRRGETRAVELVGYGVATGGAALESVTREIAFPADPQAKTFSYRLETPQGAAPPFSIPLADAPQLLEPAAAPAAARQLALPTALTGRLEERYGVDRYTCTGKKGDVWQINAQTGAIGSPLDMSLTIVGAEGKELATSDDLPGTTDAGLMFTLPEDGTYELVVSDTSGKSGGRTSVYHLTIAPAVADVSISVGEMASILLGGKLNLPVKVVRQGGFKDPIPLVIAGLPPGVTAPAELLIPAAAVDFNIPLEAAADAAATATFATVTANVKIGEQTVQRTSSPVLVATVMKPRISLVSEGKDDVRKVHRGSTFPAPVLITRLEGYTGEVLLEMTAMQQRHRQGLAGPDMMVPAGVERFEYPIFMPEWMETTKTSRVILNAVVKVPDPKGNVRYLSTKMVDRIGMLPLGALMKLSGQATEQSTARNAPFEIPLVISKAAELPDPVRLELHLPADLAAVLTAEPVTLELGQREILFRVQPVGEGPPPGEYEISVRAHALQEGRLPVMSEATVTIQFLPAR